MAIPMQSLSYTAALALPKEPRLPARKPSALQRLGMRISARRNLRRVGLTVRIDGSVRKSDGPFLILANRTGKWDESVAALCLHRFPYCTVSTADAFIGNRKKACRQGKVLMNKGENDRELLVDLLKCTEKNLSVLYYPEEQPSPDGVGSRLSENAVAFIHNVGLPVLLLKTEGAYAASPAYSRLRPRCIRLCATLSLLFAEEQVGVLPKAEAEKKMQNALMGKGLSFQPNGKPSAFVSAGLERLLYRCSSCGCESAMRGESGRLTCSACGKVLTVCADGTLTSKSENLPLPTVHDWFVWEKEILKTQMEKSGFSLAVPVKIAVQVDDKKLYRIGQGELRVDAGGCVLRNRRGQIYCVQKWSAEPKPTCTFSWHGIGDAVRLHDDEAIYIVFPSNTVPFSRLSSIVDAFCRGANGSENTLDR